MASTLPSDDARPRPTARRRHRRRRALIAATAATAACLVGGVAAAQLATAPHAGPQPDGTAVTPVGWRVTPAGHQLTLGERPYGMALSPDGHTVLVSNDGIGLQSLMSVDPAAQQVKQAINYVRPEALFLGVAFSPDGKKAYAAAGDNDKIRAYDVGPAGVLTEGAPIALDKTGHPFPAGLAVAPDGKTLFAADHLANALSIIDLATGHETRVPLTDRTCTIGDWGDTSNGTNCLFPHSVVLSRDGRTAYVSDWGQKTVTAVDVAAHRVSATIGVGQHPSAMTLSPDGSELYVANTDADSVSAIATATNRVGRTIDLRPDAQSPTGATPDALAVSPDGATLYVAEAGADDVAVVRLRDQSGDHQGDGAVAGRIPTGWYPTGIAVDPSGGKLYVANAKGLGAGPNAQHQYIGTMIKGTLSTIDVPDDGALAAYTEQVRANNTSIGAQQPTGRSPVPTAPGQSSPIKHVIYVVNENRTYDQVLGDLGRGNGDPSLALFGRPVTPNHHRLAEQFTTLDNLYAAGEVSDDGWEWSTAAEANSLTQKTMPTLYGGRGYFYAGEGGTLAAAPGANPTDAYIWNRLDDARLSYRNYGFWATDTPPVKVYNEPGLAAHTDPQYAGFNMNISDQDRFAAWLTEFRGYERSGNLPPVEFLKFPRDHTSGTSPGAPTPMAMVADSDLAVGKLVDTVSHSQFWKSTAIFVIEDDAQDGPDHVDAHRTVAHVISPYTQLGGKVDSTFYSSTSMLRTMELILGLDPMTRFDAAANPMRASFTDHPSFAPYDAQQPTVSMTATNAANAPLATASARMNFRREDRAPAGVLNKAIWQSVKGSHGRMPAPRHRLAKAGG
jgi:YVTN family beta-propeller protein